MYLEPVVNITWNRRPFRDRADSDSMTDRAPCGCSWWPVREPEVAPGERIRSGRLELDQDADAAGFSPRGRCQGTIHPRRPRPSATGPSRHDLDRIDILDHERQRVAGGRVPCSMRSRPPRDTNRSGTTTISRPWRTIAMRRPFDTARSRRSYSRGDRCATGRTAPVAGQSRQHGGGALDLRLHDPFLRRMRHRDVTGSVADRGNAGGVEERRVGPRRQAIDRHGFPLGLHRRPQRGHHRGIHGHIARPS